MMENHGPISPMGLEAFFELTSNLARYSDLVTLRQMGPQLSVEPIGPITFPILVVDEGHELTISALRWHTHEDSAEQTIACVMSLLTPFYRIVETERRGAFVAAQLETFEPPGRWSLNSEIGLITGLFGRKRDRVRIAHQQNVLPCPPDFLNQFASGALDESGLPVGTQLGSCILDR